MSCTPNLQHCGGDGGCSGATAELAFQYAKDVGVRLYAEDAGASWAWGLGLRVWYKG